MSNIDLLICGAGPVGCTIANRAATLLGLNVLVVDKRSHIGGNCHDSHHSSGILMHNYGPHYFRTDNEALLNFLSNFTEWIPGNYIVKSSFNGELYPFPINLDTLEKFFNRSFTPDQAIQFLDEKRIKIKSPSNSEEFVLNKVGKELYEAFYKNYTKKQWEIEAGQLAPSVCGRVPIRLDRRSTYPDQRYQVMPKLGFSEMFQAMLKHSLIQTQLNTNFNQIKDLITPKIATVYTGPIDEYFDAKFGRLGWRSLEFEYKEFNNEYIQPCVQINYPNEFHYTRTVEYKHITQQKSSNTLIAYEYPKSQGEPFYPIPTPNNEALYKQYLDLAIREERERNVFFVGRLANYRYYNTDQVIEEGLKVYEKIAALIISEKTNIPDKYLIKA